MLAKAFSAAVFGVDAYEVEVEVNATGGKPVVVVVGLPDAAVKECRDRVTTAVANSGYRWPRGRCTVNLAPADIKKKDPVSTCRLPWAWSPPKRKSCCPG